MYFFYYHDGRPISSLTILSFYLKIIGGIFFTGVGIRRRLPHLVRAALRISYQRQCQRPRLRCDPLGTIASQSQLLGETTSPAECIRIPCKCILTLCTSPTAGPEVPQSAEIRPLTKIPVHASPRVQQHSRHSIRSHPLQQLHVISLLL